MRSDSSLRAVSTMTPRSFVSSRRRSSASTSYPDAPGSIRSSTTRSGRSSRAARSASRPLAAVVTRYPSFARWYATSAVMSGSSSTTRMRWLAGLLTARQGSVTHSGLAIFRRGSDSRVRQRASGDRGAGRARARRRRAAGPRARGAGRARRGGGDGGGGSAGGGGRSGGGGRGDLPRGRERAPGAAAPLEGAAAALAQGRAARASRRLPPPRDHARAGAGPGDPASGGHSRRAGAGAVGETRAQSRGVPDQVRDHVVGDADGRGAGACGLRVRARRGRRRRALRGGAVFAAAASTRTHAGAGDRGAPRRHQARRGGDRHQGRGDRVRHPHPAAGRVARAGACGGGVPRRGRRRVRPRRARAGLPGARPCTGVRLRGAARHGVHLSRGRRRRPGLDPAGPARLWRPADRARHAPGGGRPAARVRGRAPRAARDVPHVESPHPYGRIARRAPVQAVPRAGRGRDPQYRRSAGGRGVAQRRVFPRARAGRSGAGGPHPGGAERLRERVSPGVRKGGVGVAGAERIGGSLMSLRRTVAAVAVTFVCALLVFTLPRFAWNSVQGAIRAQQPAADGAPRSTVPPAPQGAPRSIPQRLTGIFGIALILAIGVGLSRNRGAISRRVVAWGVGLQLVFAIFVLRVPFGQTLFSGLGDAVKAILSFSYKGSEFVFGEIGKQQSSLGVVFAFQVLPAIIFVSALFAILYYLGVMQLVVRAFAVLMNRVMGASGAESLNVAASITLFIN